MVRRDAGTANEALTRPVPRGPSRARVGLSGQVGALSFPHLLREGCEAHSLSAVRRVPIAPPELVKGSGFPDLGESRLGVVLTGHGFSETALGLSKGAIKHRRTLLPQARARAKRAPLIGH